MPRKSPPAFTPEAREQQLIALAYDLVEERIRDKTATSQEVTHFLKLGTQKAKLERDILAAQRELVVAKTDSIRAEESLNDTYQAAIDAIRGYRGESNEFPT